MTAVVLYCGGSLRNLSQLKGLGMSVEDLAAVLAKVNRFVGHTPEPYSVAQHAVLVSVLADPGWAYEALHHDDTEAFVGDLASPIKDLCPEFQALERKVRRAIAPGLGLARKEPDQIKVWDRQALHLEQWVLQGRRDTPKPSGADMPSIRGLMAPVPWAVARDLYLWQHKRLLRADLNRRFEQAVRT